MIEAPPRATHSPLAASFGTLGRPMPTKDELQKLDCEGLRTLLLLTVQDMELLLQELARRRVERRQEALGDRQEARDDWPYLIPNAS